MKTDVAHPEVAEILVTSSEVLVMSDGDKVDGGGEVRAGGQHGHRGEDGRHRHQARLQVSNEHLVVGFWARTSLGYD